MLHAAAALAALGLPTARLLQSTCSNPCGSAGNTCGSLYGIVFCDQTVALGCACGDCCDAIPGARASVRVVWLRLAPHPARAAVAPAWASSSATNLEQREQVPS